MSIKQITAKQLQQRLNQEDSLNLLDVREVHEFDFARIEHSQLIPLSQIAQRYNELAPDQEWIVICHHGRRSMMAAEFLAAQGFSNVINLTGGIDAWSLDCDVSVPRY